MSYNLLLNSRLENTGNWKLINCSFENGILTSTKKVFGIEQELILPSPTKLYFRTHYKTFNALREVKIGIQNGKELGIDKQVPKLNKTHSISLIDIAKQNKIKLHIIFESNEDVNRVLIQEPILVDINHLQKSTWIKPVLDLVLKYRAGYQYTNEYIKNEITTKLLDFQNIKVEKAKIGSIIKTKDNLEIPLSAKFIKEHYYLAKLSFDEINRFGDIYFKYGSLESKRELNDQVYLIFKANDNELKLYIKSNDVFEYKINLKHMMIIDITKMHLLQEDIPYLPFI